MAFLASILGSFTLWPTLLLFAVFLGVLYLMITRDVGKYEKRGVPGLKPSFPFGNVKGLMMQTEDFNTVYRKVYDETAGHKFAVFYHCQTPHVIVRDPELVKDVMVRDSLTNFMDFGFSSNEIINQIPGNDLGLANLTGQEWKDLRTAITPAFTLRNLSQINTFINKYALQVVDVLKKNQNTPYNCENLIGHYTVDCIGGIVYSTDYGTIASNGGVLYEKSQYLFDVKAMILGEFFPQICYWLGWSFFKKENLDFFTSVSLKSMEDRKGMANMPRDILGLILMAADSDGQSKKILSNDKTIAKTLMQFYLDGTDTTSSIIVLALYRLAQNPEAQEMLHREITDLIESAGIQANGEISREKMVECEYLEAVFNETMRTGAFGMTARRCTKEWTIPNTNIKIDKGDTVHIPIMGLQMDPQYWEDPESFKPQRFLPANKGKITPGTFLPFGQGPRQCIGYRIANLEVKTLLFHIVNHFRVETCEKTPPFKIDPKTFARIEGGCYLKFVPRN